MTGAKCSSTGAGETWNKPIRINQDAPGKHQFFSWGALDETTGKLWVIYYDRRNYTNALTDVFLASSTNGETFVEQKISQQPFLPTDKVFLVIIRLWLFMEAWYVRCGLAWTKERFRFGRHW